MTEKQTTLFFHPLFLLALAFVLRLPALWTPILDIDETQFAGFASSLLNGGLPYIDSVDTKPPLIYVFFALVFLVFGDGNLIAIHAVTIVWVWLTGYGLARLAREMGYTRAAGWAFLFYICFSAGFTPKFISTSITQLMNLPLIVAVLFFVKGIEGEKTHHFFISGLFVSAAFLFKYQAGIVWPLLLIALLVYGLDGQKIVRRAVNLSLGFGSGIGLACIVLALLGVWDGFYLWSLQGSFSYIDSGASNHFIGLLLTRGGAFVMAMLPLLYWARQGLQKNLQGHLALLVLWFWISWIPVVMGGRFYGHYFLQLMPPLCLLASIGFLAKTVKKIFVIVSLPFILIPVGLRFSYDDVMKSYGEETFEVHQQVGQRLYELAAGDTHQRLFVWGFATPIYTYAQLTPATRFLWADLLSGRSPGPTRLQNMQKQQAPQGQMEAWQSFWMDVQMPPDYFVDTAPAGLHHYQAYPIAHYPQLNTWVKKHYQVCDEVEKVVIYCFKKTI